MQGCRFEKDFQKSFQKKQLIRLVLIFEESHKVHFRLILRLECCIRSREMKARFLSFCCKQRAVFFLKGHLPLRAGNFRPERMRARKMVCRKDRPLQGFLRHVQS